MAKEKAKAKDKAKDKPAKAEAETFKYGVADVAKALGVKEASARVQLRAKKVKKAGKSYGWNDKDDLAAVIEKIRPAKEDKKAAKKGDAKAKGKKAKDEEDDD